MNDTTERTLTNGLALPVPQSAVEALSFVRKKGGRLDWWHLETVNTDYYTSTRPTAGHSPGTQYATCGHRKRPTSCGASWRPC